MTDQTQNSEDEKRPYVADSIRDACYINELWQQLASRAEQIRKLEAEVERLARHDAQNVADKIRKYSASGDTSHT